MPSADLNGGAAGCRDRCTNRSGGRGCHAIRGGLPRDHVRPSPGSRSRPASPWAPCPILPKRHARRPASPSPILPSSTRASSPKILPREIASDIKPTSIGFVPNGVGRQEPVSGPLCAALISERVIFWVKAGLRVARANSQSLAPQGCHRDRCVTGHGQLHRFLSKRTN